MEVVKRGVIPTDRLMRGLCEHCKSLLEAKQSEMRVYSDIREGTTYSAHCPVCGKSVEFKHVK